MTLDWVRKRTIADGRRVHGGAAGYTAWTPESAGESYYHIARRGNRWRVIVHVRWRANDESDRAIIAASHPTLAAAKAAVAGHAEKVELQFRMVARSAEIDAELATVRIEAEA
jgi:hypothetical protein